MPSGDRGFMTLAELEAEAKACRKCAQLAAGRTNVVFGVGDAHSEVMFVGEAPGFYEDKQGIPFVGSAGKLLTQLLRSIGLERDSVYITNILKCRPPGNRNPSPEEILNCRGYLQRQIELIRPRIICTLGNFATQTVTGRPLSITRVRGKLLHVGDMVVFPLLHPAAALHKPPMREPLEEDFRKLGMLLRASNLEVLAEREGESEPFPLLELRKQAPPASDPGQMELF